MTTPIAWDPNQLWNKALKFSRRASVANDADGTLYSCLALELLARAALTAIHPALNADPQNEGAHIMYACGIPLRTGQPKSVPVHAVFTRLEVVYPEFKPHRAVCEYLLNLRNEELHTGAAPFDDFNESKWLADYYAAVAFLCDKLQKGLDEYLGGEAGHAEALIRSRNSARSREVKKRIAAQKTVFDERPSRERTNAAREARQATRFRSSRSAPCPACDNPALLDGDEIKRSEPVYADGDLVVTVTCATSDLKCSACGLHLRTVDECAAGGIPPRFVQVESISLHELHQDQEDEEYDNM